MCRYILSTVYKGDTTNLQILWPILSLVHSQEALYNKNKKRKTNNKIQGEQSMTQPNENPANYENITTKYDEYIL